MKNLLIIGISIKIIFLSVLAFAVPKKEFSHFIVQFETGNAYDVTIKHNQLRWKGIRGEDLNMIVEVPFKHIALSKNVDIYQWKEQRGYFDTFIVDKSHGVAVTSTKTVDNKEWLVKGKVHFIKK